MMRDEILIRDCKNPIIKPDKEIAWKSFASFNGCPFEFEGKIGILYRAVQKVEKENFPEQLSTIVVAWSCDGINFFDEKQIITPELPFEKYGCEDPRVTKLGDTYYISYTALSEFPYTKQGIKVAIAKTKDFKNFEKHLITTFNAKALTIFPQKINEKIVVLLTVNSDFPPPPSQIVMLEFDCEEDLLNQNVWRNYYFSLDDYVLHLKKEQSHHAEIGAPPLYTEKGWLLIYSYITNYFSEAKEFLIEGLLLDKDNPRIILSRAKLPFLRVKESYEKIGTVPNIVFPSGALIKNSELLVYYGGADTTICVAKESLENVLKEVSHSNPFKLVKYFNNPILRENPSESWESLAVLNPASIKIKGVTHLFYRASDKQERSVIGYAKLKNNFEVFYRSKIPCYFPRCDFEKNGCEDPRVVLIDNKIYMFYTGFNPPSAGVCVSYLSVSDLERENWKNWSEPVFLSQDGVDDKDACIIPKKINDKYYFIHRVNNSMSISEIPNLNFQKNQISPYQVLADVRSGMWDDLKIGISTQPIETKYGWLIFYHGISSQDKKYRTSAMLLDLENPKKVLSRLKEPILEPDFKERREAVVSNVVFPCGAVVEEDTIYLYYGADDKWVSAAKLSLSSLLKELVFNFENKL